MKLSLGTKAAVVLLSVAAITTAGIAIGTGVSRRNHDKGESGTNLSSTVSVSSDLSSEISQESSENTSSDVSEKTSSAIESSKAQSSEVTVSSKQVSSKQTSSKSVSSKSASSKTTSGKQTSSKTTSSKPQNTSGLPKGYLGKYASAYKKNKGLKGQLVLPNGLKYYVPQCGDNSYYLNHNFEKQSSGWGVPYVDYRVSITKDYQSRNIILYGHSDDKRVLQLSILKNYRFLDFYKENPTITFNTVYGDAEYKIVAFFIEGTKPGTTFFEYHMFIDQTDSKYIQNYIKQAKLRSYINTTVDVSPTDEFLTISTCQDNNTANFNRYVLLARKVRHGEDSYVDTDSATVNSSQKLP